MKNKKHSKTAITFYGILVSFVFILANCVNSGCEKQFYTLEGIERSDLTYIYHPDSFPDTLNMSKSDVGILVRYNTEEYDSIEVSNKAIKYDCFEVVNLPDSIKVFRIDSSGQETDCSDAFMYASNGNLITNPIESYRFQAETPIILVFMSIEKLGATFFKIKYYKNGKVLFSSKTRSAYLTR